MNERAFLIVLGAGRLLLGAVLVAQPQGRLGAAWVGGEASRPSTGLLLRSVGARDMALAVGMLGARRRGSPLKPWLLGAAFADSVDLVATFAAGKAVPKSGKAAIALLAGGSSVQHLALTRRVEA